MAAKTLKIGCMDPRRREALDEGDALRISRAGGWLGGNLKYELPNILREHNVERLEITTHDQCGAVKVVDIGIRDPRSVEGSIFNAIVAPFLRYSRESRMAIDALEDLATKMQEDIALRWVKHGNVKSLQHVSCTKATTTGKVEGRKVLLLVPFSEDGKRFAGLTDSLGLNKANTYLVTLVPGKISEMVIDPQLALNHIGISTVALYAGSDDRHRVIDRLHGAIKRGELKLRGAEVKRYD